MATIKPIEGRSVHYIQSGQVISDGLNSAVKELVENSLDAHASSIEVRFKNYGLDAIEVVDNGDGISQENFPNIALKHYTSKLASYEDLDSLQTFGFRGEALSSLCALSNVAMVTATKHDFPRGSKLEFETSGKLKSVSTVAAQKGTTITVENLFRPLPVRRKELERNIKKEYTKVLGLLQAYASVSTGVKFTVFNTPPKGKRSSVFATKGNPTTRENILNVFGAKTLSALVSLDLEFEMQTKRRNPSSAWTSTGEEPKKIKILGHISKPVVGEGRTAPDRQMFFVNSRPCNLPQVSRAFNEVYKQFNVTQSPFIFANLQMDTNAYDVNVSPDKRTIMLHDQAELLESIKTSLANMFNEHEQSVPTSQLNKIPYGQFSNSSPNIILSSRMPSSMDLLNDSSDKESDDVNHSSRPPSYSERARKSNMDNAMSDQLVSTEDQAISLPMKRREPEGEEAYGQIASSGQLPTQIGSSQVEEDLEEPPSQLPPPPPKPLVNPFERMTRARYQATLIPTPTTITIGNKTVITHNEPGSRNAKRQKLDDTSATLEPHLIAVRKDPTSYKFMKTIQNLAAPDSQVAKLRDWGKDKVIEQNKDRISASPESDDEMEAASDNDLLGDYKELASAPYHSTPHMLPESPEFGDIQRDTPGITIDNDIEELEESDELPPGDEEYVDEEAHRKKETAMVQNLIAEAEKRELGSSISSEQNDHRAQKILKGNPNSSLCSYYCNITTSLEKIRQHASSIRCAVKELEGWKEVSSSSKSRKIQADKQLENATAEERLSLTVSKSDFAQMRIIGQFNKGFIITTRESSSTSGLSSSGGFSHLPSLDLFIIDQHASDEKYNFERFSNSLAISSQPLAIPKPLDNLMAMDEEIVRDNLDILKINGFNVKENLAPGGGHKFVLTSLPNIENTVFDIKDLEELIHLIHISPCARDGQLDPSISEFTSGEAKKEAKAHATGRSTSVSVPRPSKLHRYLAMRACRSSIMVGKSLTRGQMKKVVGHLGELELPWNCPHGRPTMRHLSSLNDYESWNEKEIELKHTLGRGGSRWKSIIEEYKNESFREQEEKERDEGE